MYQKWLDNGGKFATKKWTDKHPSEHVKGSSKKKSQICRRGAGVQGERCILTKYREKGLGARTITQTNFTLLGNSTNTYNATYYRGKDYGFWNSTLLATMTTPEANATLYANTTGGWSTTGSTIIFDEGGQKRSNIRKRALTIEQLASNVTNPQTKVPWNGIAVQRWRQGSGYLSSRGSIGTGELCGCTTLVIWSREATFLAHLPENRVDIEENGRWFPAPDMPPLLQEAVIQDQRNADTDFIENAYHRVREVYNTRDFPPGLTQAVFVVPFNNGHSRRHNDLRVPYGL